MVASSASRQPAAPPAAPARPSAAATSTSAGAAAAGSSDSEAVRRRTRSTRPSRSQMKRSAIYNTDSESETGECRRLTGVGRAAQQRHLERRRSVRPRYNRR